MTEDPVVRQVVESELRRFQGLLFFADIQALKRGEYAAVAEKILTRVRACWIGLFIFLGYVGLNRFNFVRRGEGFSDALRDTLVLGFWFAVLLYFANKWGKLRGSMTTLLVLLGDREEKTGEDPEGSAE